MEEYSFLYSFLSVESILRGVQFVTIEERGSPPRCPSDRVGYPSRGWGDSMMGRYAPVRVWGAALVGCLRGVPVWGWGVPVWRWGATVQG